MGRNGRKSDAAAMLNILPKFELVLMMMYFMMLAKQRRPSSTPSLRTARSFSSRMIFAASFATSTPFITEMPTSAVCSDGASLMPSPMYPTTCPREDGAVLRLVSQGGVVHGIHLAAGDHAVGCQPDIVRHLLRHVLIVASHDEDGDAVVFQRFEDRTNSLLEI